VQPIISKYLSQQDSSELKQEIARKDELIKKHYEKISIWLSMLGDPQQSATIGPPPNLVNINAPPQEGPPPPQMQQQQPPQQPMMQQFQQR